MAERLAPTSERPAEAAELAAGAKVLDVACGTPTKHQPFCEGGLPGRQET